MNNSDSIGIDISHGSTVNRQPSTVNRQPSTIFQLAASLTGKRSINCIARQAFFRKEFDR